MNSQPTTSSDNHELLIALGAKMESVGETLRTHIAATADENSRIHARITSSESKWMAAVEQIKTIFDSFKDSLAQRGRLSGQFILTMIAVLLSSAALLGGFVHFYVSTQIGNVMPTITRNTQDIQRLLAGQEEMERRARQLDVETKVSAVRVEKDIEWMQKAK